MSLAPLSGPAGGLGVAPAATAPIAPVAAIGANATTPQPAAPASPLAAMLADAAAQQDGLAPLIANLAAALEGGALPADTQAAASALLAAQAPLAEDTTPLALQAAVQNSGVFLEAGLAQAAQQPGTTPNTTQDMKALLLQLLAALGQPVGPAPGRGAAGRPPPPLPGQTAGQPPASATLASDTPPALIARTLAQQAEAALARVQLSQAASLTSPGDAARWSFEIPVALPGGTGVAQFEISRDGRGGAEAGASPTWRARFSIDAAPSGPVSADVALSGERTRVTLAAPDPAARAALAARQDELAAALAVESGGEAAVRVVAEPPPAPAPSPGRFVDART
jgi:hypothetical protein